MSLGLARGRTLVPLGNPARDTGRPAPRAPLTRIVSSLPTVIFAADRARLQA